MQVADLVGRIGSRVPALLNRVEGAAELAELIRTKSLPQATPFAFVLPLSLRGGEADAAAGAFTQMTSESFAVVLIVRAAGDPKGAKALKTIDELIVDVIEALCGWAPGEAIGDFTLERGQLIGLAAGSVQYQLEFSVQNQVRILA